MHWLPTLRKILGELLSRLMRVKSGRTCVVNRMAVFISRVEVRLDVAEGRGPATPEIPGRGIAVPTDPAR